MKRLIKLLLSLLMMFSLVIVGYADDVSWSASYDASNDTLTLTKTGGDFGTDSFNVKITNTSNSSEVGYLNVQGTSDNDTFSINTATNTIVIKKQGLTDLKACNGITYKITITENKADGTYSEYELVESNNFTVNKDDYCKRVPAVTLSITDDQELKLSCNDADTNACKTYFSKIHTNYMHDATYLSVNYNRIPSDNYSGTITTYNETDNTLTFSKGALVSNKALADTAANKQVYLYVSGYSTINTSLGFPAVTLDQIDEDNITITQDTNNNLVIGCVVSGTITQEQCATYLNNINAVEIGNAWTGIVGTDDNGNRVISYYSLKNLNVATDTYGVKISSSGYSDITKNNVSITGCVDVSSLNLKLAITSQGIAISSNNETFIDAVVTSGNKIYYSRYVDASQYDISGSIESNGSNITKTKVSDSEWYAVLTIDAFTSSIKDLGATIGYDDTFQLTYDVSNYALISFNQVYGLKVAEIVDKKADSSVISNKDKLAALDSNMTSLNSTASSDKVHTATVTNTTSGSATSDVTLSGMVAGAVSNSDLDNVDKTVAVSSTINTKTATDSEVEEINDNLPTGVNEISTDSYGFSIDTTKTIDTEVKDIVITDVNVAVTLSDAVIEDAKKDLASDEELVLVSKHVENGSNQYLVYSIDDTNTAFVSKFSDFYLASRKKAKEDTSKKTATKTTHKNTSNVVTCQEKYGNQFRWNEDKKACEVYTVVNTGSK